MVTYPLLRLVPGQQLKADGGECLEDAGSDPDNRDGGAECVKNYGDNDNNQRSCVLATMTS